MTYTLLAYAALHTCWDEPGCEGLLLTDACDGCRQAAQHPCRFCGYGEVFTTHNDLAHYENGDDAAPGDPSLYWHNSPHEYTR